MPSALPFMGLVKTSSLGMLGLNSTPVPSVFSAPAINCASGMSPTVKSVPFEEL